MLLTVRQKEILKILQEGHRTTSELLDVLNINTPQGLRKNFQNMRKQGINIQKDKGSFNGEFSYWVEPGDIVDDKPYYKTTYDSNESYGKALYRGVKEVARVQVDRYLHEDMVFHFSNYIGLLGLADTHLGHATTDYGVVEDIFQTVHDTPALYLATIGDLIDNSVNAYAPNGCVNIVDKDGQLAMLEYLMDLVRDRILVMYEGNHEIRSAISDHFRITEYLANKYQATYGQYGGAFYIDIEGHTTKVYCRHKCKGGSYHNPLYPLVRAILFDNPGLCHDADILMRGHTHEEACGIFRVGQKRRYMSVCGNTVVYDEYGDRVGFETGRHPFPMYILGPDGSIRQYTRMAEGIEDLKLLRESYAKEGE